MEPVKWLSLEAKDGTLTVPGLFYFRYEKVWILGSVAHAERKPSGKPLDDAVVSMLWAGRAFLWLASKGDFEISPPNRSNHNYVIYRESAGVSRFYQSGDLYEALYVACCDILGVDP